MFTVANIAQKSLLTSSRFSFAGLPFGKKQLPTKNDLQKYDVVVVGANLGNVFATHLDSILKDKVKTIISYDASVTQLNSQRILYEQGKATKTDMCLSTRSLINKHNAHTDSVGVEKFKPDSNEIVLRNGRTIQYENLVIAMGQKENYQQIKGFQEAWSDPLHPFYTNADHSSWRTSCNKAFRFFYNFNGGEAIFYIPPAPFSGQIQNYNFFMAKSIWDMHASTGKLSWDSSKFTIINANKTFSSQFPKLDSFIRQQCEKRNITIQQGWKLTEVKKDSSVGVFQNLETGQTIQRQYGSLYSLMPVTTHSNLSQAGLSDSTGYLNVNKETLQHVKYDNIFGIGDVNNVATTKTFYGGLNQLAVVRNNIQRRLNGLSLNAKYDGQTQAPLFLSEHSLSWVSHLYNGVEKQFSTSSSGLKYKIHTMFGKKNIANILKFKNWGPPNYKWKKSFQDRSGSNAAQTPSKLHPAQKQA